MTTRSNQLADLMEGSRVGKNRGEPALIREGAVARLVREDAYQGRLLLRSNVNLD